MKLGEMGCNYKRTRWLSGWSCQLRQQTQIQSACVSVSVAGHLCSLQLSHILINRARRPARALGWSVAVSFTENAFSFVLNQMVMHLLVSAPSVVFTKGTFLVDFERKRHHSQTLKRENHSSLKTVQQRGLIVSGLVQIRRSDQNILSQKQLIVLRAQMVCQLSLASLARI